MRHAKQSPKLERDRSYWAIETKRDKADQWQPYPWTFEPGKTPHPDGLAWVGIHRKRARQIARDLRQSKKYFAVRAIKLQRITRA